MVIGHCYTVKQVRNGREIEVAQVGDRTVGWFFEPATFESVDGRLDACPSLPQGCRIQ